MAKKKRIKVNDEEIFEQRQKGLSYDKIAENFGKNGKTISTKTIRYRCKKIYDDIGVKEPKTKKKTRNKYKTLNRIGILDKEIFEQREKGLSYQAIAEYFTERGKKISMTTISNRCKEIYRKKRRKQPKVNFKSSSNITDEEIFEQRQKGLTYTAIAGHFVNQGKKISRQRIEQRYKKICERIENKNEDLEIKTLTRDENFLREQILKLKETKGATDKQITEIAKIYGIDLMLSDKKNEER